MVTYAWQPIETAPKDGTEILVCRHGCGDRDFVRWYEKEGVWLSSSEDIGYEPTHWMNPQPPKFWP